MCFCPVAAEVLKILKGKAMSLPKVIIWSKKRGPSLTVSLWTSGRRGSRPTTLWPHNPVAPGSPSASGSRPPSRVNGAVRRGLGPGQGSASSLGSCAGLAPHSERLFRTLTLLRPGAAGPSWARGIASPTRAQINTRDRMVGRQLTNRRRLEIHLAGSVLCAGAPQKPP